MKLANLIMNEAVTDKTEITVSVMLVALGGEKVVARGHWYEDNVLEWHDSEILSIEWDLVTDKVSVLI